MNIWRNISEKRITPTDFIAVIEIRKGSKKKYEVDRETGFIMLNRVLHTSTQYPSNYGFIPRTISADGDELDVLVLCSEPLESMSLVQCYPIGLVEMIDGGVTDEKIIAVPFKDPHYNIYTDVAKLPQHVSKEIIHFLKIYKDLEDGEVTISPMQGAAAAQKTIKRAKSEYDKKFGKDRLSW
jgi:inorganic pyrophosphatase